MHHPALPIKAPFCASRRGRWSRRLAGPAATTLALSLTLGLNPSPAQAATSGSYSVAPAKSVTRVIASSRTSSATVVNIKVPAARDFYAAVQLRAAKSSRGYRAKASVTGSGVLNVSLSRVYSNVETPLGSAVATGFKVDTGDTIRLQGAIAGSNPVRLYVRAWKSGESTPAWQLATLDSSAKRITKAGKTRLWTYLAGSANASAKVSFSKVKTASTTVAKVKKYSVASWTNPPQVAAEPAPTPTPSPSDTPTPSPSPSAPGTDAAPSGAGIKPTADNTGVKPGTTLTRHDGNITVTKDGTVLSNLDIHGFVTVRAKNVTITNSRVRGGKSTGVATGLITNYGYAGLVISDVDIKPDYPSVWFDGIKGSDFTARRVHVQGGVDSVKIHGSNVTIEHSLLENTDYYASDPQQSGGPTHNDNVQILYGQNLKLIGNTIRGASNFAVLGGATKGNTNLVVQDNWLDGGHCTVKLQILNGYSETAKVTGNYFGPNRKVSSCAFTAYPEVGLSQSSNVYEVGGATVKPLIVVS